jgi:spermidine/putrescine transport system ATP-binding protein
VSVDTLTPGGHGLLMVRPEYMRFAAEDRSFDFTLTGVLHGEYALGSRIQYEIETPDGMVTVEKLREDRFDVDEGENVTVGFDLASTHFISEAS